jgi:hypothetical protein
MKPLHSVVEQQIDNYISEEVTITDAYQFSPIQQIENFMHSKFTSGQNDSRGNPKTFFNITKGKVNVAIRATDIDRKDISMKENGSDDYFRAFVASKYNQTLMKKMSLQAHTTLFSISSSTLGVATTTLFSISNTGGVGHSRQRGWHADPIMPQNLDQIAAAAPEDVKIASVRIALQALLNCKSQALHAAAHVGVARGDPESKTAKDTS